MSRSFVLEESVILAALLVLLDHLSGFGIRSETSARVDALLRPLRRKNKHGLLLPMLRLEERIEELAASFPEARAAHVTTVTPAVVC